MEKWQSTITSIFTFIFPLFLSFFLSFLFFFPFVSCFLAPSRTPAIPHPTAYIFLQHFRLAHAETDLPYCFSFFSSKTPSFLSSFHTHVALVPSLSCSCFGFFSTTPLSFSLLTQATSHHFQPSLCLLLPTVSIFSFLSLILFSTIFGLLHPHCRTSSSPELSPPLTTVCIFFFPNDSLFLPSYKFPSTASHCLQFLPPFPFVIRPSRVHSAPSFRLPIIIMVSGRFVHYSFPPLRLHLVKHITRAD